MNVKKMGVLTNIYAEFGAAPFKLNASGLRLMNYCSTFLQSGRLTCDT